MLGTVVRTLRATGADLPWGRPEAGHPGVALESWFWRLIDPAAGTVVLVALTVVRESEGELWAGVTLAAVGPDGAPQVRERLLPVATKATDQLALTAAGDGSRVVVSAGRVEVDLGPDARVELRLGQPWRWPRRALGGLGLGQVVPNLSQYWHPWLLAADDVRGSATVGSRTLALDGMRAYGEKNWGRGGTPRAWWWGQAAPEPDVAVAFAGGVLDLAGPVRTGATALAIRCGEDLASFSPGLGLVSARVGAGGWRVTGRELVGRAGWRAELEAQSATAPLDLLVPVAGERRMAPLSHQHQDGELSLKLWRGRRLAYAGTATLAGLERGGRELERATGDGFAGQTGGPPAA